MDESIKAIEEAIKETGYRPVCIKEKYYSETIMDKALGEIRKSRFVVIDLTGGRNSVFFEAGFVLGLDIEAIYVYKEEAEGAKNPAEFYIKHYQCYKYKDAEELKETIMNAIEARIAKKE
jgi:hypothetical protein